MEAAAAMAPVEASQEPPKQETAPVSAPNDAGTLAPAQRTAAAPVSAPNDAGTPALAERTAQVQGKAPRPRVAQQDTGSAHGTTGGPGAARGATAGTGAALGAAGITGSGAGVPGKPAGKGQIGNGG